MNYNHSRPSFIFKCRRNLLSSVDPDFLLLVRDPDEQIYDEIRVDSFVALISDLLGGGSPNCFFYEWGGTTSTPEIGKLGNDNSDTSSITELFFNNTDSVGTTLTNVLAADSNRQLTACISGFTSGARLYIKRLRSREESPSVTRWDVEVLEFNGTPFTLDEPLVILFEFNGQITPTSLIPSSTIDIPVLDGNTGLIRVDMSGGSQNGLLPPLSTLEDGDRVTIKKIDGNVDTSLIVVPNGTDTVEGEVLYRIRRRDSFNFVADTTSGNWNII